MMEISPRKVIVFTREAGKRRRLSSRALRWFDERPIEIVTALLAAAVLLLMLATAKL